MAKCFSSPRSSLTHKTNCRDTRHLCGAHVGRSGRHPAYIKPVLVRDTLDLNQSHFSIRAKNITRFSAGRDTAATTPDSWVFFELDARFEFRPNKNFVVHSAKTSCISHQLATRRMWECELLASPKERGSPNANGFTGGPLHVDSEWRMHSCAAGGP